MKEKNTIEECLKQLDTLFGESMPKLHQTFVDIISEEQDVYQISYLELYAGKKSLKIWADNDWLLEFEWDDQGDPGHFNGYYYEWTDANEHSYLVLEFMGKCLQKETVPRPWKKYLVFNLGLIV